MPSKTYTTNAFLGEFVFLEGPRWHDGHLWVSDIWGHTVYRIAPTGEREIVARVPGRPSGLGFLPDGTPLVVAMVERRIYRITGGGLALHADVGQLVRSDINDMVVDAEGRAYVGSFGYDLFGGAEAAPAEIVMVDIGGSARLAAAELDFPNGMVIKDGGRTLVVAESFGHRLTAFDRGPDGGLSNRRVYCELPELTPDGICLDEDGAIWVGGAMGGRFVRVDSGGQVVAEIDVTGRAAIACQLGGPDRRTLYCLTYAGGIEDLSRGVAGSRIETVRVDCAGAGSP